MTTRNAFIFATACLLSAFALCVLVLYMVGVRL
jgi:hypothetical protein